MKIGRNDPCPCGSGKKHKHCCLDKQREMPLYQKFLIGFLALIFLVGIGQILVSFRSLDQGSASPQAGKVWSEEHQHYH